MTATTRLVAEPFGRLFGVEAVLATEAVVSNDRYTGEIDGEPCHGAHKLARVHEWLGQPLAACERSWFYSDAASDLPPLLQAVTDPVAVWPDERLRAHALRAGWPLLEPAREAGITACAARR